MGTSTRRFLTVMGLAALALMLIPQAVAVAQQDYPPTVPTPGNLIVPPAVVVGGQIAVSGNACGANLPVTISFNGTPVASTVTDAFGHFSTSFPVPAGTQPGRYTVTASNSVCVLSGLVQVDPASVTRAVPASLAFTGSSGTIPTAWVAAGLVLLGSVLVLVARRRLPSARAH